MRKYTVASHKTTDPVEIMDISSAPASEEIGARTLADLFPVYLADIAHRVAPKTVTNYRHQIGPACAFWEIHGPAHGWTITRQTGPALLAYLHTETDLGQNSIRTTVRRVRQFLRWVHTSGRLPIDISGWIDLPAPRKAEIHTLAQDEIRRLLDGCTGHTRIRDLALICFLLETGARRTEAAHLDYGNVQWTAPEGGYAFLEIVKGYKDVDKRRHVVFGRVTGKLLQLQRVVYGVDLLAGPVFDLTDSGVTSVLAAVGKRAGVEVSAHDFRRTFATHWIRNCRAPSPALAEQLVRVQLGHSAQNVTQAHYLALDHTDVAKYYVSPLDGLDLWGL